MNIFKLVLIFVLGINLGIKYLIKIMSYSFQIMIIHKCHMEADKVAFLEKVKIKLAT